VHSAGKSPSADGQQSSERLAISAYPHFINHQWHHQRIHVVQQSQQQAGNFRARRSPRLA